MLEALPEYRVKARNTSADSENKIHDDAVARQYGFRGALVPGVANASDYPVDYYIEGRAQPLYLFGVPNRDKARLATIVLQHLNGANLDFNSMIVFQNASDIPHRDLNRLMNAANDMVASIDATDDLERKVRRRVG